MEKREYAQLAAEYLYEAARLKARLPQIRAARRRGHLRWEEARSLKWREDMLYRMYLECSSTGKLLRGRAQ